MPLTDAQKQTISEQWNTLTPERQEKAQRLGVTPPAPASAAPLATPTPAPLGGQTVSAPGGAPATTPTWKISMTDPAEPPTLPAASKPDGTQTKALVPVPEQSWKDLLGTEKSVTEFLEPHHLLKMGAALGINVLGTGAGAALGAATGPFAGAAIPLGAMAGSYASRDINKRLGLEEPGLGGDITALTAPLALPAWNAVKNTAGTIARYSPAGRAIRTADEATQAAQARYGEKLMQAKTAARQAPTKQPWRKPKTRKPPIGVRHKTTWARSKRSRRPPRVRRRYQRPLPQKLRHKSSMPRLPKPWATKPPL